jgi:hypothetical protein
LETEEIDFSKVGTSIIRRDFLERTQQYYLSRRKYWEQFEKKIGCHEVVKSTLMDMEELSREFLILPLILERFFFLYLEKNHPSQQNKQTALSITRVFSVLSHQYYKSATKFNMVAAFFVSPSVWDKFLIGRKAKESGIEVLKEMGLIISYRFNRNKYAPAENSRFVIMYEFDIRKLDWLVACVKTLVALEERGKKISLDDIYEDIFGYIAKSEEGWEE